MDLNELKSSLDEAQMERMGAIYERIRRMAADNNSFVNFTLTQDFNNTDEGHLNEAQIKILEENHYSVDWTDQQIQVSGWVKSI